MTLDTLRYHPAAMLLVSYVAAAVRPPFGAMRPPAALSRATAVAMATREPLVDLKMVPTRAALKDAPMPECVGKYGAPGQHAPRPARCAQHSLHVMVQVATKRCGARSTTSASCCGWR